MMKKFSIWRHQAPLVGDMNVRHYKKIPKEYVKKFNLEGLSFPMQFSQIRKFVRKIKHIQMSIRVLFKSENNLCLLDTFSDRIRKISMEMCSICSC